MFKIPTRQRLNTFHPSLSFAFRLLGLVIETTANSCCCGNNLSCGIHACSRLSNTLQAAIKSYRTIIILLFVLPIDIHLRRLRDLIFYRRWASRCCAGCDNVLCDRNGVRRPQVGYALLFAGEDDGAQRADVFVHFRWYNLGGFVNLGQSKDVGKQSILIKETWREFFFTKSIICHTFKIF